MGQVDQSWLRETLKIWLQYLTVGIAAIPAGMLYALLMKGNIGQKLALSIALALGLCCAYASWIAIHRYVTFSGEARRKPDQEEIIYIALDTIYVGRIRKGRKILRPEEVEYSRKAADAILAQIIPN